MRKFSFAAAGSRSGASTLSLRLWEFTGTALVNLFIWLVLLVYLVPLTYMLVVSVMPPGQASDPNAPLYPAERLTYIYEDRLRQIYSVPTEQGQRELALVRSFRTYAEFVDPANPEQGVIRWDGNWRSLKGVYRFHVTSENFANLFENYRFPRAILNTLLVALISGIGVLCSSIAVAYGFSRFRMPYGRLLFFVMIATIMIPDSITLVPTYFIFARQLEWFGTWYPLIVPHFFANAVLVFLLRQNFKSIPRDLDEAAMIDGASPLRILVSIILPQSVPVVVTTGLLHFFYIWNEIRLASLYLGIAPDLQTVSFNMASTVSFSYGSRGTEIVQAAALVVILVPVLVLFLAQRFFMQDMVVTGIEK
jgi:multiple sugar transport system permease protein